MFTSLRRVIGLGWQNLARDGGIAAANVFIIMIPILLTTAIFSLNAAGDFLIKQLQGRADISVYFNESVAEEDILRVQGEIVRIPGIEKADYVSRERALEDFRLRYESDQTLMESLEEVGANPFPALLHVTADSPAQFEEVALMLERDDYRDMIYKLNYNERKENIGKIFAFTENAKKIGLWLFVLLASISVLVTFNTVRMAIMSRKREIGIQRLVGASRWFIRGQFLVEGMIFGVLAAVLSFCVSLLVCHYAGPALAGVMSGMNLWEHYTANIFTILGMQSGIGVGLGAFSSLIAVGRYLKI